MRLENKWRKFNNRFNEGVGINRRLLTQSSRSDFNSLRNYYGGVTPFPGFTPQPYPTPLPMPDEVYEAMIEEAVTYLGEPYLWGGKTPPKFDCSGFVGYLYIKYGIIPDTVYPSTVALFAYLDGYQVPESEAQPGDLCCWRGINGAANHIAIYLGDGNILDSSRGGVDYRKVTTHRTNVVFMGYYRCPEI